MGMRRTTCVKDIRIVISEGENDYKVYASQAEAESHAK